MAIAILRELREKLEEALKSNALRTWSGARDRYEIISMPEDHEDPVVIGIAWREDDPGGSLLLAAADLEDYVVAMRHKRETTGTTAAPDYAAFIHCIELRPKQIQLLWPHLISRLPPLQALAASALA